MRQLFGGGLFAGTLLLWLSFFMSLLIVYLLTNWMPTLIQQTSGASLADAARLAAMFQIGGTIGAIIVGRLMDPFEPHGVFAASTSWRDPPWVRLAGDDRLRHGGDSRCHFRARACDTGHRTPA